MTLGTPVPRGTATSGTSTTSFSISPSVTIATGKLAVLNVVSDNASTTGGATSTHAVSDSQGHAWTKIHEETRTSGVVRDGLTVSSWATIVQRDITTSDTVALALVSGAAFTAKALSLWEVSRNTAVGIAVIAHTGANGTGSAASTTHSLTLSSLTSREYLFVGVSGMEADSAVVSYTEDASFTTTTAKFGLTGGTSTSDITQVASSRVVTATSQTWAPSFSTGGSSADRAQLFAALAEIGSLVSGAATISGAGSATSTGSLLIVGHVGAPDYSDPTALYSDAGTLYSPPAFAGQGSLTVVGRSTRFGGATATGVGDLTVEGTRVVLGAASMVGAGSLALSGLIEGAEAVDLLGTGSLVASGFKSRSGSAALTAAGSLDVSGRMSAVQSAALTASGSLTVHGFVPTDFGDVGPFAIWARTARSENWDGYELPDRWDSNTRPDHWFNVVFIREDREVTLTAVAYGPFTENEIPEALLVRVLRPLRAGGTIPLEIFNQSPAYTATVSIQPPSGTIEHREAEIVDPDDLPIDYPADFSEAEEGWVRIAWEDGDFPDDGVYRVQVTLDNGIVRLKSTDVWTPEVNVGPASAVGA